MADAPVSTSTPAASAAPATPSTTIAQATAAVTNAEVPSVTDVLEQNPELTKAEAKKMIKELKIKFNGEELTEKLPFEIPDDPESIEYMRKQLQMSKLSQSKSQESSRLKKDVEAFFSALQGDTKKVLKEMGIDPKKFAEQVINEEIEELNKSPEQKEKEKLMTEVDELRKKLKAEEEAKKSAEMDKMQEKFALEIDNDITEALGGKSKLPKSPYVVKRIADSLLLAYKNGYTTVTAKDIIPLVEKEIVEELQGMFGIMPEEAMEAVLGKGNMDRLRKNRLQRAKKAADTANSVKPTGNDTSKKVSAEDVKKASYKEFFGKF